LSIHPIIRGGEEEEEEEEEEVKKLTLLPKIFHYASTLRTP
jgi:hypothetical protein